jgi:hypothetical protein
LANAQPDNVRWQRDLSVSDEKIGNALVEQGKLSEAITSYRADLAISERLAAAQPADADAQRDLAVSHAKLGMALKKTGQLDEARVQLLAGRDVIAKLAAQNPDSPRWKDLATQFESDIAGLDAAADGQAKR